MSNKKRYTKSFMVTLCLYGLLFLGVIISFKPLAKPVVLSNEKTIALNHIALVAQEKKVIEEKSVKKEELKKEPKKEPEKKIEEKPKPKPKKEPIKEEKPKPILKEQPKDTLKEKALKEETKEQEALQKSTPKTYEEVFLDEHLHEIVKQIQQHIIYPKRAKELNIQGEVTVEFKILHNGSVENIKALKGHVLLKKSALKAIEEASQFFPKVKKDMTIKVPIVYSLRRE